VSNHGINVDYINPFIEATIHTFQTMCSSTPTREPAFLKGDGEQAYGISGVIALGGEAVGTVVLAFPEAVAISVVGKFVGEPFAAITARVVDGVGELANLIAGDAKNRLVQKGFKFEVGAPKIITGRSYVSAQNKSSPCVVVPFSCEFGKFRLEASLKKVG
jgi:chemotaxis protein CheX